MNFASLVADAWQQTLEETPAGYPSVFNRAFGLPVLTYRERLDTQPVNAFGRLIPRIVTVRRNLRAFKAGNTMTWRGLDVRDRRHSPDRRRS